MKKPYKVVLIGCGTVGSDFLFAAINQGLAAEYVIMDYNFSLAEGQVLDILDTQYGLREPFSDVRASQDYSECSDADIIVICAGRSIREGETRLDIAAENSKIIKGIAENVRDSGFKGITIVSSNPVDILTRAYIEFSGFDKHKVIGSGTSLDTARLRRLLAEYFEVSAQSVDAYIMGEHGDSSLAVYSASSIAGKSFNDFITEGKVTKEKLDEIHKHALEMAYTIIDKKGSTSYGVASCLVRICHAVLNNTGEAIMCGVQLGGEYKNKDVVIGVPTIIKRNGWSKIIQWNLTKDEQDKFNNSCTSLEETWQSAIKSIKK